MSTGPTLTAVIAIAAMIGVGYAFLTNASPYVTIDQAKHSEGDRLHLMGQIQKDSITTDLQDRSLRFKLKDSDGAMVTVKYTGEPPESLREATQVVAIGQMKGDSFVSQQLLLKCPSKYQEQKLPDQSAPRKVAMGGAGQS